MISPSKNILKQVCILHSKKVMDVLEIKIAVFKLCLDYFRLFSKGTKQEFADRLKAIPGNSNIKIQTVNWFLKPSTKGSKMKKGIQRKILSINKVENFFRKDNRRFSEKFEILNALSKQLAYFRTRNLLTIISGNPLELYQESIHYNTFIVIFKYKYVTEQVRRSVGFLFDYDEFSKKESIFSDDWGAYVLAEKLDVRSCLYCNRNYILTVTNTDDKIIRPEFDHFFPKSDHPILALSFYNLIPSCHICNSNLKGKKAFSLDNYFHPYLNSFDNENVKFTYEPTNPKAFFGDKRALKVKLDTTFIRRLKTQIFGNINIFKLDEIYDYHQDIIVGFLDLQRKTNKKKVTDIFENILVDSNGKKYAMNKKELYELAIRNYYNEDDFYKRPLSKFERDIAIELKLI